MRPDDNFAPDARNHCSFLDTNLEYKRQTHGVIQQAFGGHIQDVLHEFRLLNGNFYVKPPGTGEFQVHQNWPAVTDLGYIDNPNRRISEHEFAELLRRGDATRAALNQPPVAETRQRRNWFGRSRPSRR